MESVDPAVATASFNAPAFREALLRRRERAGWKNWLPLAESGVVSATSISRLTHGSALTLASVIKLLAWLEADLEDFVTMTPRSGGFRVIVTGSRQWTDARAVVVKLDEVLREHPVGLVLVHGACGSGADRIASMWARRHVGQVREETFPVSQQEWARAGRAAGPLRNRRMVRSGADLVLAFPRGESRGTRGCMQMAQAAGLRVVDCSVA